MAAPPPVGPESPEDLIRVLQAEGVRDRRVLAAFRTVPRPASCPRPPSARRIWIQLIRSHTGR